MKTSQRILQWARLCIGISVLVISGTAVWGAHSGSAGTTQRFRGTVVPRAPQVTAQEPATGMTLRFPHLGQTAPSTEGPVVAAGTTLRFLPLVSLAPTLSEPDQAEAPREQEGRGALN